MFFMDTLDIKNAIKLNFFTVDMLKNVLSKEYDQPIQKINYMVKNGDLISLLTSSLVHISELPDSDAGVVPDTFAMRFSRV